MRRSTKKIFAREFLFLLGTTIIYFLILFLWIFLVESKQESTSKIKDEISEVTENKELPFRLKVFDYLNSELDTYERDKYYESENFISNLKSDEIMVDEVYNYLIENKKINLTKAVFKTEINDDVTSELYLKDISALEKEVEKKQNSFFYRHIDDDSIIGLAITFFSIFFLLRYLIYGTQWSLKQVKEKY